MVSLRVVCSAQGIRRVEIRDGKVMFEGISGLLMRGPRLPRLQQATTDLRLDEIIRLARTLRVWSR
jgi:hypothetical protein